MNGEEPTSVGGMVYKHSFVPTLPSRAEHAVPNPWSSSGLKLKSDLSDEKVMSPRQIRFEKFQNAVYVKEDTTYVNNNEGEEVARIKSSVATDAKAQKLKKMQESSHIILNNFKKKYYRPAIKVGKLIPDFSKNKRNMQPARPQSSQHKRAYCKNVKQIPR
eukprot:g6313.t1